MTFKDYGVSTPQDFFSELNNKALEIAFNTNDQQTKKDETCIAAFLFDIKTWDKDIGEQVERLIQKDMSFTEVTIRFFQKLTNDAHMKSLHKSVTTGKQGSSEFSVKNNIPYADKHLNKDCARKEEYIMQKMEMRQGSQLVSHLVKTDLLKKRSRGSHRIKHIRLWAVTRKTTRMIRRNQRTQQLMSRLSG